ncbi:tetrapyrrole methylase [Imleria badia]|nr:tetrapyrrole methylase [Imleria badia]
MPELCDFSFTATHRFIDPVSSSKAPLQIGVTTNREGCRLAGRVRREIVAGLSKDVGAAVTKVAQLRKMARKISKENEAPADGEGGEDCTVTTPNRPVPIRPPGDPTSEESGIEAARRQMRWVVQVSEYWPISRLAGMTERGMKEVLDGEVAHEGTVLTLLMDEKKSQHGVDLTPPLPKQTRGRILLAGSGPGHPSLLTLATHMALTRHADIVLSDKLVPAPVLDLIPPHVDVRIARKFPGNADSAQTEMMVAAVEAANRGLTVVRLKQGDPIVYARAGEELAYFRAHGYAPLILPGLSSALAAPACAGIPVTHRGVAESFIVCTGVGRQGKAVSLPGYDRARTVLVLMGVAWLGEVRVLVSTLEDVESALAGVEQRPPGMIVIGWAVMAFGRREGEGGDVGEGILADVEVDAGGQERRDRLRIAQWLGGRRWDVWEGLGAGWEGL